LSFARTSSRTPAGAWQIKRERDRQRKGAATLTLDLLFTGGTGLFAGVTGEATATEKITRTSSTTETITGTYSGTLVATPLPATWVMLLRGFVGLGAFAYRGPQKG
jgi:hypothetical protein